MYAGCICGQAHFFADLRDKQDVPAFVDGCHFVTKNGTHMLQRPGRAVPMFDNHVYYTGYRVICMSPFIGSQALDAAEEIMAGLTWQGKAYQAQIPVTQVHLLRSTADHPVSCSNPECRCPGSPAGACACKGCKLTHGSPRC